MPQLILQARILYDGDSSGVDEFSLYISVLFAVFHLVFEGTITLLDSKACKISFFQYSLQCLGARLDFIPFGDLFKSQLNHQIEACNDYDKGPYNHLYLVQALHRKIIFDYEKLVAKFCGFSYQIEFEFSNHTIRKLAEFFIHLPSSKFLLQQEFRNFGSIHQPTKKMRLPLLNTSNTVLEPVVSSDSLQSYMVEVKFGNQCCRNVQLFAFGDLLQSARGKMLSNMNDLDWLRIFRNTQIKDPNSIKLMTLFKHFVVSGDIAPINIILNLPIRGDPNPSKLKRFILSIGSKKYSSKLFCFGNIGDNVVGNDLVNESECLAVLKKYSDQNVLFGLTCSEARYIYGKIIPYVCSKYYSDSEKSDSNNEAIRFYTVLFYLFYTQHAIFDHECAKGCCRMNEYLLNKRLNMVGVKKQIISDEYLPVHIFLTIKHENEINYFIMSLRLASCIGIFKENIEQLITILCTQPQWKRNQMNAQIGTRT